MNNNDFTKLNKYSNQWVAIKQDDNNKIVGAGKSLREALEQAKRKGINNPILTKTPEDYGAFIL